MADALLVVKIVTDYAEGQAGLNKAASGTSKFKSGLAKMAAPAAIAAAGIAAFGKAAVDAASRTQQAIGAVDSVFGRNAGQVKKWASSAATSVGLAKSEYMELASVMGAQLKNMGIPMDQIAGKTDKLIRQGADMAATYGGTTAQAVEALGSALRGETDPIEKYGVSVKQADIAAQQAKDGTDKLTGAAGKQAKTMALLALVNEQTADAQEQFARESDSAAGSAQIAAAQYEDMKSNLGTALLPAVSAVTTALGKLAAIMSKHKGITTAVIVIIGLMAVAILALNVAVGVYTAVTTLAASTTLAAWAAALWPITLVIAGVALVVAGFVLLWKKSALFRKVVTAVWKAMKAGATAAARVIKAVFSTTFRAVQSAARALSSGVRAVWNAIRSAAAAVVGKIRAIFSSMWSAIRTGASAVKTFVVNVWNAIKDAVGKVVTKVGDLISKIKNIQVPGAILTAFNNIKTAADNVLKVIKDIIDWIKNIPVPKINWPSPPKWLDKITGRSVAPAPEPAARAGLYGAPAVASPMARGVSTSTGTGPTIVIQGAVDPEAVARQIRRILGGHDRRIGGVSV